MTTTKKTFNHQETAAPRELALVKRDPYLAPYEHIIERVHDLAKSTEARLTQGKVSLQEFAMGHWHFGAHCNKDGWVLREWAPNAVGIFLIGPFSKWQVSGDFRFTEVGEGNWEIKLPGDFFKHEDLYRIFIQWPGGGGERIPAYARRVLQDEQTKIFSAQIWRPETPYKWRLPEFKVDREAPMLVYESHVGMAQEEAKIGSYTEFKEKIIPRIVDAGYTAVELMAIAEHPYYGSFGYQVSNFYAPSSRFGTPDELRSLIDTAHEAGLCVFMDIVHSHAVKNEVEGLGKYDGTHTQFFHEGPRGTHPVWDSLLFDYQKPEVLHFLLSNVRYWVEEYHFDGFRFDGVTSMLYHDHGLGEPFTSYDKYFYGNLDQDALAYLLMANKLAHSLEGGEVITIAEDVSGLPGLASPIEEGGFGFDYRLAMGVPDFWVKTIEKKKDEDWNVEEMYGELSNRRADEKTISYAESHDQALVGDKTIIFRLLDAAMYDSMLSESQDFFTFRGTALHRLIRLVTLACSGHGYLNFMGNEFGHPEWIDFPREGNNWSCHHARRLWSIRDNQDLEYYALAEFDKQMIAFFKEHSLFDWDGTALMHTHVSDQVLGFWRKEFLFLFNFNPSQSFTNHAFDVPAGTYKLLLNTDDKEFGGHGRVEAEQEYHSSPDANGGNSIKVYLPSRSALVLKSVKKH